MKTGLVSVMMPAYNAELYIGQAIESVLSQSYINWELIVVNDGSSDGTARLVQQYADPRIKLINQPNGGEASARNTALQHMSGEFIAFLDADDLFLPDHLQVTMNALQQNPELDGVYTDGIHIKTDGVELPTLSSRRRGPFQGWIFEQLVRASDVFGPPICVVIRREKVVQQDLWFDPRIIIGPDWDFFTRFAEFTNFGYLDKITCKYRIHVTNISFTAKHQVRLNSLALCRRKAIQLSGFSTCSVQTRAYVFYDLLLNLENNSSLEQETVMQWSQFLQLPEHEQARLLRLVAGKALAEKGDVEYARKWLERSRKLVPMDMRGVVMAISLKITPVLTADFLRWRYARLARQQSRAVFSPFADLSRGLEQ